MHPPTSAYPWQPAPPPRKRAPWKIIGIATGSVLTLCCGGFLAIGIFADPPASQNKAVTAADQVAGQQQPPAPSVPGKVTATPAGAATVKPSPSRKATSKPTTAPKTTKPKPATTTTRPKPKPTTKPPAVITVTPGAFCSDQGATGVSKKGKTYRCTTKAGDDRLRWRPV